MPAGFAFAPATQNPKKFYYMMFGSYPVQMLPRGYNGSEMAPYLYEAKPLSTTIALHPEADLPSMLPEFGVPSLAVTPSCYA